MCDNCDTLVESARAVIDKVLVLCRQARINHPELTVTEHITETMNSLVMLHAHGTGYLDKDDVQAICVEYAIMIQRLLALEELSGITT